MKAITKLGIAAMLLPAVAVADDHLNYDYVDFTYTSGEIDAGPQDVDTDLLSVGVSASINENLAFTASLGAGEIETGGVLFFDDTDVQQAAIGVTPHYPLSDTTDIVIPVAIQWVDLEVGNASDDDTGFSVGVGIRSRVNQEIELAAGIDYVDVGDDDDTALSGSIRYHANDAFSVALGASYSDDVSSFAINGRFAF